MKDFPPARGSSLSFRKLLGSVKGLIAAMGNAQDIINQINWAQWATARF